MLARQRHPVADAEQQAGMICDDCDDVDDDGGGDGMKAAGSVHYW